MKLSIDEKVPARPVHTPRPAERGTPDESPPAKAFKNDPLIQEAIEMFKGEIRT